MVLCKPCWLRLFLRDVGQAQDKDPDCLGLLLAGCYPAGTFGACEHTYYRVSSTFSIKKPNNMEGERTVRTLQYLCPRRHTHSAMGQCQDQVLYQDKLLCPCCPHRGKTKLEITENIKKAETYKDRLPQEVVRSLSSEMFKPRLLPVWDRCRQNVSTYGGTDQIISRPFPMFGSHPWGHTWDSLLHWVSPHPHWTVAQ